jgi:hypothetical protein
MTGVAAQMCGSLDHELKYGLINWKEEDKWGRRKAIVSDLSPMANFIASLYTTPVDLIRLDNAFSTVIKKLKMNVNGCTRRIQKKAPSRCLGMTKVMLIILSGQMFSFVLNVEKKLSFGMLLLIRIQDLLRMYSIVLIAVPA